MVVFDLTAPEVWYPIPSVRGYEVSSHYRVRRWVTRFLHAGLAEPAMVTVRPMPKTGYLRFETFGQLFYLHRVIKEIALGRSLRKGEMVLHKNDDRLNNHPRNLKLGNHQLNVADAHRNGRYKRGAGIRRKPSRTSVDPQIP